MTKENECVKCGCYNLTEFKKVEHKHIHCLDCYRQLRNAKQREYRKIKKQKKAILETKCRCDEEDDGFEDCNVCGYAHHYEDKCPNENTCEHYEKMTFDELCDYVHRMDGSDVSEGWSRNEIIEMIQEMEK
jgi:hypothetical protein